MKAHKNKSKKGIARVITGKLLFEITREGALRLRGLLCLNTHPPTQGCESSPGCRAIIMQKMQRRFLTRRERERESDKNRSHPHDEKRNGTEVRLRESGSWVSGVDAPAVIMIITSLLPTHVVYFSWPFVFLLSPWSTPHPPPSRMSSPPPSTRYEATARNWNCARGFIYDRFLSFDYLHFFPCTLSL